MRGFAVLAVGASMLLCGRGLAEQTAADLGIAAPPGFEVTLYADDDLAHDIFSMTIDSRGRVVVAGQNYVKILHDTDGDDRADQATLFSPVPASGAHGMAFDGNDLICTGDNSIGRLRDADGDGVADGPMEVWTYLRHPEHGANGIARGPDGWFYLVSGNDAGVSEEHAMLPSSPVKQPRCGAVVRFSPDGRESEVYAHGFRNPYDLDFSAEGNLFTVDADGERDHHLPWYAPTRLFDVAQGMEHGWLLAGWQRSWNRPESFFDNVERLVEMGRGSPTGLLVYRHRQFPAKYFNGVLSACWTMGRVYFLPLARHEASFKSHAEVFLQTTGDTGFAPVDLAVGPEGDLFVAIGGRGTRGGVFRVSFVGDERAPVTVSDEPLDQVLLADQPLAAWSRARWLPLAREIGASPFEAAMIDPGRSSLERVRAVEILTDVFDGLTAENARAAIELGDPELTARIAWAIGRRPASSEAMQLLADLTRLPDSRVRRAAWEAWMALPVSPADLERQPEWVAGMTSSVRRERVAVAAALARGGSGVSYGRAMTLLHSTIGPLDSIGMLRCEALAGGPRTDGWDRWFSIGLKELARKTNTSDKLDAVRCMQLALGDLHVQPDQPEVYSGYSGNGCGKLKAEDRAHIVAHLAPFFPTDDAELNCELARLLGMLNAEHAGLLEAMASQWTAGSTPHDDIHYLIVFSRLGGPRPADVTRKAARALVGLQYKMAAGRMYPSRNWPLRVGECFDQLLARDPALGQAVLGDSAFGLADHSLYAAHMRELDRPAAARKLLAAALTSTNEDESPWTGELVEVVGSLPAAESLPILREQWTDFGLRDAIALVLARESEEIDRQRLVEALDSTQPDVIVRAAEALSRLSSPATASEIAAAMRVLRQYCAVKEHAAVRGALAGLLAHWSGQTIAVEETEGADLLAAYHSWFDWFASEHPDEAARLAAGSMDMASWQDRLGSIDWSTGDIERGKLVFEKRACHRCHQGSQRLGPDLAGAAARFSREDLFTAIVDPNNDVSPLYQTHLVVTRSGRTYTGLLVYESPDGTLVQTAADTTVRVAGDDLAAVQPSRQSLMPVGLLNELTNEDLADLDVYLRTLVPR
jgi:putative membrane-bound dehydrogenase-like protein